MFMKNLFCFFFLFASLFVHAQQTNFKNLIERDGKIGIGTSNPDELLTVKGTIHTQEVQVDLKGAVAPDYVFEKYFTGNSEALPSYEFLTLEQIENFIKENHHLPKIPSAKELEKEGMALKEMNLLLLEKIEELTLHVIRLQKEIDELKENQF